MYILSTKTQGFAPQAAESDEKMAHHACKISVRQKPCLFCSSQTRSFYARSDAETRKCAQKSTNKRKSAKQRKRALPRKNCKQQEFRRLANCNLQTVFREFLDQGLEKGWPESLCKEQSQITLWKSPLTRSRKQFWGPFFAVFWALLVANPLPPTPFRNF